MKKCDLHSHSHFSDGTLSPAELVALAEKEGVSALALTDHDTSKGLKEFMTAGYNSSVITVPGCEFSTDYEHEAEVDGKIRKKTSELHIVGLFMHEESWPEIEDRVEFIHLAKINSNNKMIKRLQKDGYDISFEEVDALTDGDVFNRAHVARVLLNKNYVKSVKEAFDTILSEGYGYYIPLKRLSSYSTIEFIKANGGVAVLAHPFLNLDCDELDVFLPEAKKRGLDAIETIYSLFDESTSKKARDFAEKYGFLQSGGSDFHGSVKPDIFLGRGHGDMTVPFDFYSILKEKSGF